MRPLCVECLRARSVCICEKVLRFGSGPKIVILQHPHERKRTVATGRIVRLSIADSVIVEGARFNGDPILRGLLSDDQYFPILLYPGGRTLSETVQSEEVLRARRLMILIADGTWSTAKTMVAQSRDLDGLPRVRLSALAPSAYRFRKQPHAHCLSTVEAVHLALEELDRCGAYPLSGVRPHDRMIEVFSEMAERQLRLGPQLKA